METVEKLIATAVAEMEKVLSSKTVVGDPIVVGEVTIIPLMSVGFGFGAGGGDAPGKEQGSGGGSGGGGGIKPVAVIIVDAGGARVEPLKGAASSLVEKVAEAISKGMERREETKERSK